jgi:serine phosphatase RsbU (regulator of sigma subunit)
LLPAIVIGSLADYWYFVRKLVYYAHLNALFPYLPFNVPLGSYYVNFYRIGDFIFVVAILIFLVQRTVRIARERNRVAAELEAARSTQELLLARSAQPTPGFHVETIYYPASEVGGDFFLVASMPNGGLLAIVGDVSGKGLLAAMRVAMILGVLRREDCLEPAAVLHNLNEALLTQGESGFTTACCVQIEPDGRYTVANAGHISPYIDGREVATSPSLPLGLTPDQHYAPVTGSLAADQKIVLLSDGVVEARSTTGELLGFERLAQLTLKSAREIANTAKAFGQQDDITVLTLARTA